MSGRREVVIYGGLLAIALGAGLLSRSAPQDSTLPSVANHGAAGLAVLQRYLVSRGHDVRALNAPLTELPRELHSIVLPAPTGSNVTREELAALTEFVSHGGTLVVLAPPFREQQPELAQWLKLSSGAALPAADQGGATVQVTVPGGLFHGLAALRLASGPGLEVKHPGAVAVTEPPAVWWFAFGKGEVIVAPGADLASNRYLELDDNAAFWSALAAKGPLAFDEGHHQARAAVPPTRNLVASVLQLFVVALALLFSYGRRLGPPRPTPTTVHRSSLEYVDTLASLTQRSHVEPELATALRARLRERLVDRLGVSPSLPFEELARLAADRSQLPRERFEAIDQALARAAQGCTPATYARLAHDEAVLELAVEGEKLSQNRSF